MKAYSGRRGCSTWPTAIKSNWSAIEAGIAEDGVRVLGVDALEQAVGLARARGVDAVCADVLTWTPPPGP